MIVVAASSSDSDSSSSGSAITNFFLGAFFAGLAAGAAFFAVFFFVISCILQKQTLEQVQNKHRVKWSDPHPPFINLPMEAARNKRFGNRATYTSRLELQVLSCLFCT